MARTNLLIDTDVIIDYLRGSEKAINYLTQAQSKYSCYLSTITIAELYTGVQEGNERQLLGQFIDEFNIANLNQESAQKGGLFRREYGKSHGSGLVDCIIAAIAVQLDAILITLNKKHFPMLKKIKVPYQK